MLEINERPLMGVSEWGKPVVMTDISTESSTRIFEGIKDISCENLHENNRAPETPRPRKKTVEKRGRITGKKVKRVNSKGKLIDDSAVKIRPKQPQKSSNTVAKLASINDLTVFTNTCHSNQVKPALSNSNFLNEESTVKLKGGKGLKGLFQSLLRTQSQKRRSQGICSGMNGPVEADAGEAAVLTTKHSEDIPDCNVAATSDARLDNRACDKGDTADKTLTSYTEISSRENSVAAGNTKVSTTKTQYKDMQIENLGPTGNYKDTIGANSAIFTPELKDDISGRPRLPDCDMILRTSAKLSTVTHSDIDVPNMDIDDVLLSQSNQTVESESKFKTKTNANVAEIEKAAPVSTQNFCNKNGTSRVKANIKVYEEMETKRAKNVIRPHFPSSFYQQSNFEENPNDDDHAYVASNKLNSSPENTTTLIEMYMFKDYGMRSSVSDQSLHIDKKETDTINIIGKLAQDAPMFSQSVESVINDKSSAAQDKNLGLNTNDMTKYVNINLEKYGPISNTVRALGNERTNQPIFESLGKFKNRKSGIHLQENTYVATSNLDTNRKVHSNDTVLKVRRDSKIRDNIPETEWYKPGTQETAFADKFIIPEADADKDTTNKESQPSPKSFLHRSDNDLSEDNKGKLFKQEADITAEEELSRDYKHSLHEASATICDHERNLIESADTCAYYEGTVSNKMYTTTSFPHQFKYLNNSEEEDKQKTLKGILRRNISYKATLCENECTEPEYYHDNLDFQERQPFSSDRCRKKYINDDTNILTFNEGNNYHIHERNTTLDSEPLFAEVNRCDKGNGNRYLNSRNDNDSEGVTCNVLEDGNGLTMEQCKYQKVVTRHLQEFTKDKEMDKVPDFFSQTRSPKDLSNSKSFTGRKHSLEKHTIDNHTHESGIFVNDVTKVFPHQQSNDKGTHIADIDSLIEGEAATCKMSEFGSLEPEKVIPLKQEKFSANVEQQFYRNSDDDSITFQQQQLKFNEKDEFKKVINSQSENEITVFKESDNSILDKPGLIQQECDLNDEEQDSYRYSDGATGAVHQNYYNEKERNDSADTKSSTENKITTLKSRENLTPDNGVLIQQEPDFSYDDQQYYRKENDVKDTLQQIYFIEKEENDAVTKSPIEKESKTSKAQKSLTLDNSAPVDQEHFSTGEEEQFYRSQTSPTAVYCPDKEGINTPSGGPASENELTKENELSDMAHYPIESISDLDYGEPCRSADESAWEDETLKECVAPDMVSYPIESVSDFVCMHKLSDVIEKEGITTSKSSTTWEYATSSDFYWNNLSEYADTNTKTLNNSYEKNIDIVEDDSKPAEDLLDENVMPERNARGNEETPRVNFSRDIKRDDFQHVAKVQSVSCMTDETGMVDGKDKLLDLVEKYKVPIGMSVAAACAAIFIMKKN